MKKNVNIGDKITFGAYKRKKISGKEPIEWLVLDKNENGILVISDKGLDCKQYTERYESVTWETCTLRKWLNGDFYKSAFSVREKKLINTTSVVVHKNPKYKTKPGTAFGRGKNKLIPTIGNDTNDKIFLLSITEVEKYFKSKED